MGLLGGFGRLGSLIGSAVNGYLISRNMVAPLGLASAMMLAGSIVTVCMTLETKGRALEDNVGEAEEAEPAGIGSKAAARHEQQSALLGGGGARSDEVALEL
jgi:hypothetical protein